MTEIPEDINKFLSGVPVTQRPEFCSVVQCPYSTKSYLGDASQYWQGAILIRCFVPIEHYNRLKLTAEHQYKELMRDQIAYIDLCDWHYDQYEPAGELHFSPAPWKEGQKWKSLSD